MFSKIRDTRTNVLGQASSSVSKTLRRGRSDLPSALPMLGTPISLFQDFIGDGDEHGSDSSEDDGNIASSEGTPSGNRPQPKAPAPIIQVPILDTPILFQDSISDGDEHSSDSSEGDGNITSSEETTSGNRPQPKTPAPIIQADETGEAPRTVVLSKKAENAFNNSTVGDNSYVGMFEISNQITNIGNILATFRDIITNIGDATTNFGGTVINIVTQLAPDFLLALMKNTDLEPRSEKDFMAISNQFINQAGLDQFYKPNNPYLQQLSRDAAAGVRDQSGTLNTPGDFVDMTQLALYNTVILCDDSGSMKTGDRIPSLNRILDKVVGISTILDPHGISMRFLNTSNDERFNNIRTREIVTDIMSNITFKGATKLGGALKEKILEPLVFEKARKGALYRPFLVSIITDGEPCGEDVDHLKNTIIECKQFLKEHGFKESAVIFQVSQIGDSPTAEEFIKDLEKVPEMEGLLYCTSEKLDQTMKVYKDRKEDMERWLLHTLVRPIKGQGCKAEGK